MFCDHEACGYANDLFLVPRNTPRVERILATVPDKNEQIDTICAARGCITIDVALRDVLDAYLNGKMSLSTIR